MHFKIFPSQHWRKQKFFLNWKSHLQTNKDPPRGKNKSAGPRVWGQNTGTCPAAVSRVPSFLITTWVMSLVFLCLFLQHPGSQVRGGRRLGADAASSGDLQTEETRGNKHTAKKNSHLLFAFPKRISRVCYGYTRWLLHWAKIHSLRLELPAKLITAAQCISCAIWAPPRRHFVCRRLFIYDASNP